MESQAHPQFTLSPIQFDPENAVSGETVLIKTRLQTSGSGTGSLTSVTAQVHEKGNNQKRSLTLWKHSDYEFPIELAAGRGIDLQWRFDRNQDPGDYRFSVRALTTAGILEATGDFQLLHPPEIHTVSIAASSDTAAVDIEATVRLQVEIENRGEEVSDPMILMGADSLQDARFEKEIPSLNPGERSIFEVEVSSPATRYEWITTYRQLPAAITLRTRSGSEKFEVEVPRSRRIGPPSDSTERVVWQAESFADLSAFQIRYFELTQAGLRPTQAKRFFDLPPGELEFSDTSQVFAATQAALASLENPGTWWMTPTRLQTSPTRRATPIRFRLPWDHSSVLAKVSPKFGLKNQSYLGYPTPFMTLTSDQTTFELNASNT
ncbi:MAG: hypothetical protein KC931_24480, partial [Candidatus Omnitrophica bacterium]|nr:hypothetical protein [Candidatus Omnitrophota bacterium]